ncbi:hypothetical protein BDK51DRAFT_40124 [Blyttiomyces helicus]|uniref:Chromo domain-containing protein n=1 Tax=Blyttiomyces helicus TaxID=388810 RepID=A0A4P9WA49_9FUNG|nr:hypothetical protein BDK51DRAFT_40124 [Blyttiomyces helicus]|eukprot:RKO88028.1 hypothetical protein BDK51DRAFT_40124 [Blyttiomyces helicus]
MTESSASWSSFLPTVPSIYSLGSLRSLQTSRNQDPFHERTTIATHPKTDQGRVAEGTKGDGEESGAEAIDGSRPPNDRRGGQGKKKWAERTIETGLIWERTPHSGKRASQGGPLPSLSSIFAERTDLQHKQEDANANRKTAAEMATLMDLDTASIGEKLNMSLDDLIKSKKVLKKAADAKFDKGKPKGRSDAYVKAQLAGVAIHPPGNAKSRHGRMKHGDGGAAAFVAQRKAELAREVQQRASEARAKSIYARRGIAPRKQAPTPQKMQQRQVRHTQQQQQQQQQKQKQLQKQPPQPQKQKQQPLKGDSTNDGLSKKLMNVTSSDICITITNDRYVAPIAPPKLKIETPALTRTIIQPSDTLPITHVARPTNGMTQITQKPNQPSLSSRFSQIHAQPRAAAVIVQPGQEVPHVSPAVYRVRMPTYQNDSKQLHPIPSSPTPLPSHQERMELGDNLRPDLRSDSSSDHESETEAVVAVVDSRTGSDGVKEWLVEWDSGSTPSWIKDDDLRDCDDLIAALHKSRMAAGVPTEAPNADPVPAPAPAPETAAEKSSDGAVLDPSDVAASEPGTVVEPPAESGDEPTEPAVAASDAPAPEVENIPPVGDWDDEDAADPAPKFGHRKTRVSRIDSDGEDAAETRGKEDGLGDVRAVMDKR